MRSSLTSVPVGSLHPVTLSTARATCRHLQGNVKNREQPLQLPSSPPLLRAALSTIAHYGLLPLRAHTRSSLAPSNAVASDAGGLHPESQFELVASTEASAPLQRGTGSDSAHEQVSPHVPTETTARDGNEPDADEGATANTQSQSGGSTGADQAAPAATDAATDPGPEAADGAIGGPGAGDDGVAAPAPEPPSTPLLVSVANFLVHLFPFWVVAAAACGVYYPEAFWWFGPRLGKWGLMAVMAGLGMHVTPGDVLHVLIRQKRLVVRAVLLQYTVLPALGFVISRRAGLDPAAALGVALVSCMPTGVASCIAAFIARADLPLALVSTCVSTLAAMAVTPRLSLLITGGLMMAPLHPGALGDTVLGIMAGPAAAGAAVNLLLPEAASALRPFVPLAACSLLAALVGSAVAYNRAALLGPLGQQVLPPLLALHAGGFGAAYLLSRLRGSGDRAARVHALQVGMRSSAVAAALAAAAFPGVPAAAATCVLSTAVHATLGALLAGLWRWTG